MLLSGQQKAQIAKPSDREIVITRAFAAPPQKVFDAMTKPDEVPRWFESTRMTLERYEADVKAGGAFRYVFRRPSGAKLEMRGVFEQVDAPRRWVHTETYDFSPLRLLVTLTLEESGGKTLLTQTILYPSKEERDGDFDAVAGSVAVFEKLDPYSRQSSLRPGRHRQEVSLVVGESRLIEVVVSRILQQHHELILVLSHRGIAVGLTIPLARSLRARRGDRLIADKDAAVVHGLENIVAALAFVDQVEQPPENRSAGAIVRLRVSGFEPGPFSWRSPLHSTLPGQSRVICPRCCRRKRETERPGKGYRPLWTEARS